MWKLTSSMVKIVHVYRLRVCVFLVISKNWFSILDGIFLTKGINELLATLMKGTCKMLKEFRIVLSMTLWSILLVASPENEKHIDTISHYCRAEKNRGNPKFAIFVNDKDISKMSEEAEVEKPMRIKREEQKVEIGIKYDYYDNDRAHWFWKQGIWNDG